MADIASAGVRSDCMMPIDPASQKAGSCWILLCGSADGVWDWAETHLSGFHFGFIKYQSKPRWIQFQ
jgi:hypothetical protein